MLVCPGNSYVFSFYRLKDYDRNSNFVGNLEDSIVQQNDSVYTVEWPSDALYSSVNSKSETPDLDIVNITTYFLGVYTDNVGMTEYAAVQRKGYNMMMNEYLMALVTSIQNDVLFYRGQVHSENTKSLSYFVNIAIKTNGNVVQSMCECAAGKGPQAVCKHIACVCYAILRFREHSEWVIKKTPTENKQKWHEPKKSKLNASPIKAEHLKFDVEEYNVAKRKQTNLCFDPRPDNTCSAVEWNDVVRNRVINYCSSEKNRFGISGVFQVASLHGISHDHDYLKLPILDQYVLNRITVTPKDASMIEQQTRQQSLNKMWHSERSLRVTGSHVFNICKFTDRRDQVKYAEDILFPKQFKSQATEWGSSKEKTAVEAYESMSYNKVQSCGFWISNEYPYIGASPDGLIGELTVLEVKCPFSIKDEFISVDNYKHIEFINNEYCLKQSSPYYFQIQTQLLVTGRKFCDFFVWTNKDEKRIYVNRNDKLISEVIVPKVTAFYHTYMIPLIAKKMYN
ncbi:uncharacterized protein LOC125490849 [Plutella xylostella]|uniref:uncharacterized protein LOC125490849 n=1 Tax=Plutella xylostella TaxID=51655 RepID=UPI0020329499|nr:uncharacterized protein LOC125490849 [Plutella xylostella]